MKPKITWEDISVAIVSYRCYLGGASIEDIARKTKYSKAKITRLIKAINFSKTGFNSLPKTQNMKTKIINLYSFQELSEDAKQKAIQGLYDINVTFEWWEYTYEDAANIGLKLTGFDLDRNRHATGYFIEDAEDVATNIMKEHGENCETFKTAKSFMDDRSDLVAKYSDGLNIEKVHEDNEFDFDNDLEDLSNEFLRSLLEDYSIILQKEYDYQTSEAAIIEAIEANEYYFTEDGELA